MGFASLNPSYALGPVEAPDECAAAIAEFFAVAA